MRKLPNIGIIGKGAIGCLLAAEIEKQRGDVNIDILLRNHSAGQTLPQVQLLSEHSPLHLRATRRSLDSLKKSTYDVLFVPIKCYQIASFLSDHARHIATTTLVVFLHNGMGSVELAQSHLPQHRRLFATTTQGAWYNNKQHTVIQGGEGLITVGHCDGPTVDLHEQSQLLDLCNKMCWSDDQWQALHIKLCINAVINPLSVKYQCKNGDLLPVLPKYRALITEIVNCVSAPLGLKFEVTDIYAKIETVMRQTADNYSSMYQDISQGRATELDGIVGYLLNKAVQHGIEMPETEHLYRTVLALSTVR
mgnify:CR=1 FL=1